MLWLRYTLMKTYLEYTNNYLTIEKFAEDQNLNVKDMEYFINLGRKIYHHEYEKED